MKEAMLYEKLEDKKVRCFCVPTVVTYPMANVEYALSGRTLTALFSVSYTERWSLLMQTR